MSNPYSTPEGQLEANLVFCRDCGAKISKSALNCPSCGAQQNAGGRSKVAAGLLAIFLGGLEYTGFILANGGVYFICYFSGPGYQGLLH